MEGSIYELSGGGQHSDQSVYAKDNIFSSHYLSQVNDGIGGWCKYFVYAKKLQCIHMDTRNGLFQLTVYDYKMCTPSTYIKIITSSKKVMCLPTTFEVKVCSYKSPPYFNKFPLKSKTQLPKYLC